MRRRHGARCTAPGGCSTSDSEVQADLALLTTEMESRPLSLCRHPLVLDHLRPDAIITAYQVLWLDPRWPRACCPSWPSIRATEISAFRDSAPGKIMHEAVGRDGRSWGRFRSASTMAGSTPRRCSWPWPGGYAERTGDLELIEMLWRIWRRPSAGSRPMATTDGDG